MVDQHETANIIGADVSSQEIVVAWARSNQPIQSIGNNRKCILAWLKTLPANTVIGMKLLRHCVRLAFLIFTIRKHDNRLVVVCLAEETIRCRLERIAQS